MLAVCLLGVLMHYANDRYKSRVICSIDDYLSGAFGYTLASLFASCAFVAQLAMSGQTDISQPSTFLALLSGGYALDSVFNKAPEK